MRGAWTGWRSALSPAGTRSNTIARRFFVAAGLMVLGGILLAPAAMLLELESTEWAFIIVFWFGIVLAVPAFVAILVTRPGAGDDHKPEGGDTWSAIGLRLEKMTERNSGMLRAFFDDCAEIRMGSRFQLCRLRLEGSWIPSVPNDEGWQNISATSPDGRFVALVRWDTGGNGPGFRILAVDCRDHTVQTTERIFGCCESLAWRDGVFVPTTWRPPAGVR